jgi:ERCC4-type nuclease
MESDYLRVEVIGRESPEETAQYLREVAEASRKHRSRRVLFVIRASRAVFKLEEHSITSYMSAVGGVGEYRVALVGDSSELHASHSYMELTARQRGLDVRAFGEEAEALEWLRSDSA